MAGQYRVKRKIFQSISQLSENGSLTVDLPRGYDAESYFIRLTGVAHVTTGGTAVRALAPCQLLKRVELIADGKNTISSVPGWYLAKNPRRGQTAFIQPPTAASAADYNVEGFFVLDQSMIDGIRPKDSNLRTQGLQLLQMKFTLGQLSDMFTGSAVGNMTTFMIEIGVVETVELADPKTGEVTKPLYLIKRSYQEIALTSNNANQQIILPVGNILRSVDLLTTISGEPSNAVLNNVTLQSNQDVRVNLPGTMLQRLNSMDYDPTGILTNSTGVAVSSSVMTGFYSVDLMRNGNMDTNVTNAWDLSGASEAKLVVDVNGTANTFLTVVITEIIRG